MSAETAKFSKEQERSNFEHYCVNVYGWNSSNLDKDEDGFYKNDRVQMQWNAWRARAYSYAPTERYKERVKPKARAYVFEYEHPMGFVLEMLTSAQPTQGEIFFIENVGNVIVRKVRPLHE